MYTLEELKEKNSMYDRYFMVRQDDVDKVNHYISVLNKTRDNDCPQPGDLVQYTNKYGEYYPTAQIETQEYGGNVCLIGTSHLYVRADETFSLSTSGGPFKNVDLSEMKLIGKGKNTFWTWGSLGAGANRGIYFEVEVNLWEYVSPEWNLKDNKGNLITTKDYDRFYIHRTRASWRKQRSSNYKYLISKSAMSYTAFENADDLHAWMKTYKCIVDRKTDLRTTGIVWGYKEKRHGVSPEEFESLNLPEDTFLMNARVRRCKRKYDDENHILHTYFVWYWGNDWMKDSQHQNEVIDSYAYDWREHKKEFELARKGA